jgi:uncharacterized membrane protein
MDVRHKGEAPEHLIGVEATEDSQPGSPFQRSVVKWIGIELSRAFGGALLFSLPILMTQETWYLGFYMSRERLALFLLVGFPLLVGLSH